MIETSQATFQRDVIETSTQAPVLVDFWAPWCGPCRALGPLLERIEATYAGRLRVVKVNSDENPALSAQFQVRSIPYVLAFVDGQVVDSFVGVLPEAQLRAFVERLIPDPAESERRRAQDLLAAGDPAGAVAALRAALALDPARDTARLDLATLLVRSAAPGKSEQNLQEAAALLAGLSAVARQTPRCAALESTMASIAHAATLPATEQLEARVQANPGDLAARLDLAELALAEHRFEDALAQLVEIARRDRAFGDDVGRRKALTVFELLADQPAVASAWRRRLAAALNR